MDITARLEIYGHYIQTGLVWIIQPDWKLMDITARLAIYGHSQTMSAAEGGEGVCKMLTMADKGGKGGNANAEIG